MSFMNKLSSFFGLEDEEFVEPNSSSTTTATIRKPMTKNVGQPSIRRTTSQTESEGMRKTEPAANKMRSGQKRQENRQTQEMTRKKTYASGASQTQAQAVRKEEPTYEYESQVSPEKKIVAMRKTQTKRSEKNGQAQKIMIIEPRGYSEAMNIARHILNGESVLVNFNLIEEYQARRIVDFLTGTVYAEDGDIKRVGNEIFLCTPKGIEIDGTARSLADNHFFEF